MKSVDYGKLRRELDDAITYADLGKAILLANKGLDCAQKQELLGEVMYFKAQKEIINENFRQAIKYLNLAVKYNPFDGAAFNDRALCIIELEGDVNQALSDFDKGIEVEPDYATVYHNKGWLLNKLGYHQESIMYFMKTLEFEPGRAVTYENIADAYSNIGDKEKAIKAYKQALQYLKPEYPDIRSQLESKIQSLNDFDSF